MYEHGHPNVDGTMVDEGMLHSPNQNSSSDPSATNPCSDRCATGTHTCVSEPISGCGDVDAGTAADGRRRAVGCKRCSNALARASGYRFRYPTYREGYGALIRDASAGT